MEPISVSLLCYALYQVGAEVVTSALEELPKELVKEGAGNLLKVGCKSILDRARSGELAPSHDLQRAARRAYLNATFVAASQYRHREKERDSNSPWVKWADDLCEWLKAEVKQTLNADYNCPPSVIDQQYDQLLQQAGGPEQTAGELQKLLSREIVAELNQWHQKVWGKGSETLRDPSAVFESWLKEGWVYVEVAPSGGEKVNSFLRRERGHGARMAQQHATARAAGAEQAAEGKIQWFPIFAAFFAEELKTNQRVEAIFNAKMLTEIKQQLANGQPAAASVDVERLQERLGQSLTHSLEDWGREFCGRLNELQRLVKEGNYAVLGKLAALGSTQDRDSELLKGIDQKTDRLMERLDSLDQGVKVLQSNKSTYSNGRVPRQLPPGATAEEFFGRKGQLAALIERLRSKKNSAVIGPPGLGKTALAAEALRNIVGETDEALKASPYPDGVVLLDFYQLKAEADSIYSALAGAFLEQGELQNEKPATRAKQACVNRRALIIFEGAEEADGKEGRAKLSDLLRVLAPENCRVILSRDLTQAVPVETIKLDNELAPEEAAALFDKLTGQVVRPEVRDEVLGLLVGHPLAITWAGGLLARGDEAPGQLAKEWKQQFLPPLSDPVRAEHTLQWLYERSVRGLTAVERRAMSAAGLLANAPFPLQGITSALQGENVKVCRQALTRLVQSGFLRLSSDGKELWSFTHVLAYKFARKEKDSDKNLLFQLAKWARTHLDQAFKGYSEDDEMISLSHPLLHGAALLRCDRNHELWSSLTNYFLYDAYDAMFALGRLELVGFILNTAKSWLEAFPVPKLIQPRWQREYGTYWNREGAFSQAQGNLSGALAAFKKSNAIAQHLANLSKLNYYWQNDLSVSWNLLGNVHEAQGNIKEALHSFNQSKDIVSRLVKLQPENTEWQRDMGVCWNKFGDIYLAQDKLHEALTAYNEGQRIALYLAKLNPKNNIWQRDLSVSWNKIGEVYSAQGKLLEATNAYLQAQTIRAPLSKIEPNNAELQRDMGISAEKIGNVYFMQGQFGDAYNAFMECKSIRDRLSQLEPKNAQWQHDLFVNEARLAQIAEKLNDLPRALLEWEKALVIISRLAEMDHTHTIWQQHRELARAEVERLKAK